MFTTKLYLTSLSVLLVSTSLEAQQNPTQGHQPQVHSTLKQAFQRMDINKDGFLDRNELARGYPGTNPNLRLLSIDRNRDGLVSWTEFDQAGESRSAQVRGQSSYRTYPLGVYQSPHRKVQRHGKRGLNRSPVSYSRSVGSTNHRTVPSSTGHQR